MVGERACRRDGVVVGRGSSEVGVLVLHMVRVRGEGLVQARSDRRRYSGCTVVSRLEMVARLGMAVVRTAGGRPLGVVVAGVRMWPLVSSWLRVRVVRSCWIQGTFLSRARCASGWDRWMVVADRVRWGVAVSSMR